MELSHSEILKELAEIGYTPDKLDFGKYIVVRELHEVGKTFPRKTDIIFSLHPKHIDNQVIYGYRDHQDKKTIQGFYNPLSIFRDALREGYRLLVIWEENGKIQFASECVPI